MNPRTLRSESALFLASIIWGFAFVAQRAAMDHLGPFLFNAVRFGIGTLTLLPFMLLGIGNAPPVPTRRDISWSGGALAGVMLFGGSSLQQAGMVSTTAGKAGFITALYVVLVPLLGLFARHRPSVGAWIGVVFALIGLYFLCIQESLHLVRGDALVLGATIFWALHILLVASFTPRIRVMTFACVQFATCAILCGAFAFATENPSLAAIRQTITPLLYAGVLSTGVAFTLQIVGQRATPPAHAAILLALEGVFAAVGGALLLGESMTARQILGCALILCGVVVSQLGAFARSLARSGSLRAMTWLALFVVGLTASGCGRTPPEPGAIWRMGTMSGSRAGGDVLVDGRETWIAYEGDTSDDAARIRIVHVDPRRRKAPSQVVAVVEGTAPSLARDARGGFVLVHALRTPAGDTQVVCRRAPADGRTWSAPSPLGGAGAHVANSRLAIDHKMWLVPAVRDSGLAARIVLFHSRDSGTTWEERDAIALVDVADPAVASCNGTLLLVARSNDTLLQCSSTDGGMTWSAFTPLAIAPRVETTPHNLTSAGGRTRLTWTDAVPDSGVALPAVRALRVAETSDGGQTWSRGVPIVWRAGSIPSAPALAMHGKRIVTLFADCSEHTGEIICLERDVDRIAHPADAAASALRLWTQHTLARPMTSQRLFIEGYFMRGLVAAHTTLRRSPPIDAPLDTPAGLQRAVGFAEWMLAGQTELGYWPLGYKAVYVADMAAVVALYAELAPHVEPKHARRYVASAETFAKALVRDGMLLPTGAVGVGWPDTRTPSESTVVRTPYLVSTSLAGIAVHAWLYSRTQNPAYRDRALQSLEYTLAQIQPDGSLAGLELGETIEGPFLIAAYVQEGWMAADAFLRDDNAVREKLRRALPAHVDWLVHSQRADGTWDSGADGEFARTTPIVSFLLWYDERCASHAGARAAVERAAIALTDPDRWVANGILRAGKHEEVLRALSSRPLVSLATGD